MVVVAAAMNRRKRKAASQGLKGVEAAAHLPASTADTSSQGNSSKISPAQDRSLPFVQNQQSHSVLTPFNISSPADLHYPRGWIHLSGILQDMQRR